MQQRLAEQELGAVIFTLVEEMLNQARAHLKGLSSGGISSSPFLKENKQEFGHRILQKLQREIRTPFRENYIDSCKFTLTQSKEDPQQVAGVKYFDMYPMTLYLWGLRRRKSSMSCLSMHVIQILKESLRCALKICIR